VDSELDAVARYGLAIGFSVRNRTVLVEGTTDADLFRFAARLEFEFSGISLLGTDLAVVAAGSGNCGGTRGVIRELLALRAMARICLLPNGRPRYRIVGLFDNDRAGKQAVREIHELDTSVLEYKDVFRLWPIMPMSQNLDPRALQGIFERENVFTIGLDWELEDALSGEFVDAFLLEHPEALVRSKTIQNRIHRDLTADGKARLHQFIRRNAMYADLVGVCAILKALRLYLGLK